MIRTVHIPRRVNRMGLVQAGDGGSASSYSFGANGLSNDPQLASYLRDLTPAQLQTALNGGDPSGEVSSLLEQEQTGTGAGYLPSGAAQVPASVLSGMPTWAWIAGGALGALLLAKAVTR